MRYQQHARGLASGGARAELSPAETTADALPEACQEARSGSRGEIVVGSVRLGARCHRNAIGSSACPGKDLGQNERG